MDGTHTVGGAWLLYFLFHIDPSLVSCKQQYIYCLVKSLNSYHWRTLQERSSSYFIEHCPCVYHLSIQHYRMWPDLPGLPRHICIYWKRLNTGGGNDLEARLTYVGTSRSQHCEIPRLRRTYLLWKPWGKLWPHSQAFYTSSFWSLAVSKIEGEGLGNIVMWSSAQLSYVIIPPQKPSDVRD